MISEQSYNLGKPSNINANKDWSDGQLSRKLSQSRDKFEAEY